MPSKLGFFHRAVDGVEAAGYGLTSAAAGTVTGGLTLATTLLALSLVGIPGAVVTGPLAAASLWLTAFSKSKANHKLHHLWGHKDDSHAVHDANKAVVEAAYTAYVLCR